MTGLSTLDGLLLFTAYISSGLAALVIFTILYTWVTPYDEAREIREGHMAPAIALTGAMIGFTFPILVASYTHAGFLEYIGWLLIACAVQLAVFWALHWQLPRVIETNNTAGALCFAAASVCAGLINAASFVP
jgi:putative membrane protein